MEPLAEPQVHLWTRAEYYEIAKTRLFEGKRVELIEGQIFEMSPMGSLHATAVALVAKTLERVFEQAHFIRWQMPLTVGELSEPEPDIAVIAGDIRDYKDTHPTTAVLIVEIAETSLEYDRTHKASLYAKAGITDYWIVNVIDRQVEIYRGPVSDSGFPYGFSYAELKISTELDSITPLAKPGTTIPVTDLLP